MEINKIENSKTTEKLNKIELFFLKINKTDKPLARLTEKKKNQIKKRE